MIAWVNRGGRFIVCLLPLAGLLIFCIYSSGFSISREWKIGPVKRDTTDVSFIFNALSSLRGCLGSSAETEMLDAITMKSVVIWGYATGLVLIVLISVIVMTGYVIWNALRDVTSVTRAAVTTVVMAVLLIVCPLLIYLQVASDLYAPKLFRQFWSGINSQLTTQHELFNFINVETLFAMMGFIATLALGLSVSAILWPLRELKKPVPSLDKKRVEKAAQYVAMQMKQLRLVLYVGAILLVVIMFRHSSTLNWMLEYLKPFPALEGCPGYKNANVLYGQLEALVANNVMAISIMNTLVLAGLYVPAAWILHGRAMKLSEYALKFEKGRPVTAIEAAKARSQGKQSKKEQAKDVTVESDDGIEHVTPEQEEWMKKHGLTYPFKEQLPKVVAILSPLLAGPIGELLKHIG